MPTSRYELTKTLHDGLAPHLEALGFHSQDKPSDDPVYLIHFSLSDDSLHYRRFFRQSPLGYDMLECHFKQYTNTDSSGYVGVALEIGVHIKAFEELKLKLGIDNNPFRFLQKLSDVSHHKVDLGDLKALDVVDDFVEKIMEIINTEGKNFWSQYQNLDAVQNYFQNWPEDWRYSPRGVSNIYNYLLPIAYLKQDRQLFDEFVKEYQPQIRMEGYKAKFDAQVKKLSKAFDELNL